jgi:hypothetical protein
MPRNRSDGHEQDERLRELRDEVFWLRRATECLLPEKVARVLPSYRDCGSLEDAALWHESVTERVLEFATPRDMAPGAGRASGLLPAVQGRQSVAV